MCPIELINLSTHTSVVSMALRHSMLVEWHCLVRHGWQATATEVRPARLVMARTPRWPRPHDRHGLRQNSVSPPNASSIARQVFGPSPQDGHAGNGLIGSETPGLLRRKTPGGERKWVLGHPRMLRPRTPPRASHAQTDAQTSRSMSTSILFSLEPETELIVFSGPSIFQKRMGMDGVA